MQTSHEYRIMLLAWALLFTGGCAGDVNNDDDNHLRADSGPAARVDMKVKVRRDGKVPKVLDGEIAADKQARDFWTAGDGAAPKARLVTVIGGTGSGMYLPGKKVAIGANSPPAGKVFAAWTGNTKLLKSPGLPNQTFTMPARTVTFRATYKQSTPTGYRVTVYNGTGDGKYQPGAKVIIKANSPLAGKVFAAWTGDTKLLASPTKASQSFTMPARALTFTATYKSSPPPKLNPCQGALCWKNAPTLGAPCGATDNLQDFSSGKYNVHRYPFTPPKNVTTELTLTRTAGSWSPALIIQSTAGVTLYDGAKASAPGWLTITPLSSGKGAAAARVRLKASANQKVHVYVTSWASVSGNFAKPLAQNVKYTLRVSASCPVPAAVCPMTKSLITFGSGFFTSSQSNIKGSPNYTKYKRDGRPSHSGYDLNAKLNTPVYATQSGKIVASSPGGSGDCGKSINLAANSGVTFRYCHLEKVLVTSGAVKAGQLIGHNGKTGNANSPHIHFVYIDAPNITHSGYPNLRSSKVNKYIDNLCL